MGRPLSTITLLFAVVLSLSSCGPAQFSKAVQTDGKGATTGTETDNGGDNGGGDEIPGGNDLDIRAQDAGPFETAMNTPIAIPKKNILTFVTTQPGRTVSITGFGQPAQGTVIDEGTQFRFVPANNFVGSMTFRYRVTDSAGFRAEANVLVNVRTAASEPIYANTNYELFRLDPNITTPIKIADFTYEGQPIGLLDIAISRQGLMYGVSSSRLFYINAANGQLTLVKNFRTDANVDVGHVTGLTFLADGRMVIGGTGLYYLDAATKNVITRVGTPEYQTSGDVIGLPDGFLYWVTSPEDGTPEQIHRVNPSSGQTVTLASLTVECVWGLGYVGGQLWGFAGGGEAFVISPATGSLSSIRQLNQAWSGATTNPVFWP